MSRVIMFSRFFPAYHPRKGEPTCFVEKIYNGLEIDFHDRSWVGLLNDLNNGIMPILAEFVFGGIDYKETGTKGHTIRIGNRWKAGDKFSPRVWSGKPYRSKQIIIAPDIEVKKTFDFSITKKNGYMINGNGYNTISTIGIVAGNDGLATDDFELWFAKEFSGQIICWNNNINY